MATVQKRKAKSLQSDKPSLQSSFIGEESLEDLENKPQKRKKETEKMRLTAALIMRFLDAKISESRTREIVFADLKHSAPVEADQEQYEQSNVIWAHRSQALIDFKNFLIGHGGKENA